MNLVASLPMYSGITSWPEGAKSSIARGQWIFQGCFLAWGWQTHEAVEPAMGLMLTPYKSTPVQ